MGNFKFGTDPQLFSEKNNFNIPKEISAKQVIEFDENILVRFDKNKLTQVVISNKNTSILYNDLKLFSKDVLDELIKNEKVRALIKKAVEELKIYRENYGVFFC